MVPGCWYNRDNIARITMQPGRIVFTPVSTEERGINFHQMMIGIYLRRRAGEGYHAGRNAVRIMITGWIFQGTQERYTEEGGGNYPASPHENRI